MKRKFVNMMLAFSFVSFTLQNKENLYRHDREIFVNVDYIKILSAESENVTNITLRNQMPFKVKGSLKENLNKIKKAKGN